MEDDTVLDLVTLRMDAIFVKVDFDLIQWELRREVDDFFCHYAENQCLKGSFSLNLDDRVISL